MTRISFGQILSRGKKTCKGPGVEAWLACAASSKEASEQRQEWQRRVYDQLRPYRPQ